MAKIFVRKFEKSIPRYLEVTMIKLANNAKCLAAYITIPDFPNVGARATGVVLALWYENLVAGTGEFVTWNVWEADPQRDIFEAETGHYFSFHDGMDRGRARQEAEIDFGRRIAMHMSANTYEGLRQSCGGI